ncbi:MAG: SWIM zinc finger family protein [Candidatus Thermoplasmatota archaeon]|jgi:uncharacterized Zn finger protein|nr:SWIM zinc finger family protein [Candidatus Thermoplasmatota archaeon]MCL5964072.1 SWIM zinc finger family protein [Candidatus Thermoplasmatota archaeon]
MSSYDYWDNYPRYPKSTPRTVKNGISTKSKHGAIGNTWWSKKWLEVLERIGLGTRLSRGRSYARRGQVVSMEMDHGVVKSKVQGSQVKPYNVIIKLKIIDVASWDKIETILVSKAIFLAKLLAGEMPENIEEVFRDAGIDLFPTDKKDLETDCSCPDWENPCKHIAAVYYIMAEKFDEDPFLLFKLRGADKEELIKSLREKRVTIKQGNEPVNTDTVNNNKKEHVESVDKPLKELVDVFWGYGNELEQFSVDPTPPEIDNAILKRMGKSPFTVNKKDLSEIFAEMYTLIRKKAEKKILE